MLPWVKRVLLSKLQLIVVTSTALPSPPTSPPQTICHSINIHYSFAGVMPEPIASLFSSQSTKPKNKVH